MSEVSAWAYNTRRIFEAGLLHPVTFPQSEYLDHKEELMSIAAEHGYRLAGMHHKGDAVFTSKPPPAAPAV